MGCHDNCRQRAVGVPKGMLIYKIMTATEWRMAVEAGQFEGSDVDRADGFIHFSAPDQVAGTASKHFAGIENLVLIAFSADDFGEFLKWEPSRGGALFPHLYGKLAADLAMKVEALPLGTDGLPKVPLLSAT